MTENQKAYTREYAKRKREERKALTGSSYDKEHYEKYKALYRKAQKKYYARIRAEKIASGEILTKEQRKERAEKRYKERIEKTKAEYRDNVNGRRDYVLAYGKDYVKNKYKNDPEWQAKYLREYRKKKSQDPEWVAKQKAYRKKYKERLEKAKH